MNRLYKTVSIVFILAVVGFLGIVLSNHVSRPVADSNINSVDQVLAGANPSPMVPVSAAGNAQQAGAPALTNPEPAAAGSVLSPNNAAAVPTGTSARTTASLPANAAVLTAATPVPSASINTASTVVTAAPGSGAITFKTKAFDKIALGLAGIMNNVWGAPSGEVYNSGIYQSTDGTFGWFWNRESPIIKAGQTYVTPIYPSIRIGGTYSNRSISAYLPVKLADARTLIFNVAYDYPQRPLGSYDLAYDLFLSDAAQPDSNPKIAAEVMIWIDGTVKQPSKCYQGDFTDGTNTFALYSWTMADGRTYYSFVLRSSSASQGQYQIDAGKLLSQIKLNSNWLLHGVEFGTEVYNGSGQIHISQFGITLNGSQILK